LVLKLPAREDWTGRIEAGGKYFVTRNGSSTIAFTVGKAYKPGNGVAIIAGHIDALTAKVKPVSNKPTKAGYVQLGVAQYAGALNETWWDRDLSIGGRVIVRDESGKTSSKLVKLDWPSKYRCDGRAESSADYSQLLGYRLWPLILESG
jgi:aminopeptidase I